MPLVSTKVDLCKGHDACAPRPPATFSPNVTAEGFLVAREEDDLKAHGCSEHPPHGARIVRGYPRVFANGKRIAYVGAPVSCPSGQMDTGRPSVILGEGAALEGSARRAEQDQGVLVAALPNAGVVSDMGDGLLIATDHREREGLFRNNTGHPLLVLGDRQGTEQIEAVELPPGGSARGDAVMFPDASGAFSTQSQVFKVPNRSTWDVTVEGGRYQVRGAEWGDNWTMNAAKARNGGDHYEWMDMQQFFRIMGKDQIYMNAGGTSVIL